MYYVYVPKAVAPTPSMVVFLHATYTMPAIPLALLPQWEAIADQYGILVVWPISTWDPTIMTWRWDCDGCESGFADPPDDSGFIHSAIVTTQAQYGITPGQTFVAGMSSGGYMTQRVAMEHSDVLAAIASASGAQYIQPLGTTFVAPVVPNPVSVYQLNGDVDVVVPYCGGTKGFWANVKAYSPSVDSDVDFWADQNVNSCSSTSQSQPLCTNGNPTAGVNWQGATGCKSGTEVIFEREIGIGHEWVSECLATRQRLFDELHAFDTRRLHGLDVERGRCRQVLVSKDELRRNCIARQLNEACCSGSASCIETVPCDFLLLQDRSDPASAFLSNRVEWVRSVCPWATMRSGGEWRTIQRPTFTNEQLTEAAESSRRVIAG